MKDDIIARRVLPPQQRVVNYRVGQDLRPHAPDIKQLSPAAARAHALNVQVKKVAPKPVVAPAPQPVKPTPAPTPPKPHTPPPVPTARVKRPSPFMDYRTKPVEEVLLEISSIEAEESTDPTHLRKDEDEPVVAGQGLAPPIAPAKKLKVKRRFPGRLVVGIAVALVVLGITGYVSVDTWLTNKQVIEVVNRDTSANSSAAVLGEGSDESEVEPNVMDNYTVAADLPRVLTIDKIGIAARILPMGINADGAVQAPVNIFDSGWYTGSAKPGEPGAALIDAHASGATREGLFAYLDTLVNGDIISVERGDGTELNYKVVLVETVDLDKVDMRKLLQSYNGASEGLNLITCTGKWIENEKTYNQRVTVYTERV